MDEVFPKNTSAVQPVNFKYSLRICKIEDLPKVMDVNETTLPENYPLFFYEQILEKLPEAFTIAYLTDDPSKIIGYIMWRIERGLASFGLDFVKKGHLVSLAVLERYRRNGVANALLTRSMNIIQDLGVSEFVLEVRVSNTGAIRLYEDNHRYEKIKIITQYYRDGEDAFYMANRNDPSGRYRPGTVGMIDEDVYKHYRNEKLSYYCYYCPNCHHLMIKSPRFVLKGSISPNDPNVLSCAYCSKLLKIFDISKGLYDHS